MAVFICECCGATLKKTQIEKHCQTKCRNAWAFTCIECMMTFEGYDYKQHNECMTEQQKFAGSFLERQREEKEQGKKKKAEERLEAKVKAAAKEAEKKARKEARKAGKPEEEIIEEVELSEKEKRKLRKYLKNKSEFAGWSETAVAVIKNYKDTEIKAKKLSECLWQIFKLSEDYESDCSSDSSESDDSDDDTPKNAKQILEILKKVKAVKLEGKKFSLA